MRKCRRCEKKFASTIKNQVYCSTTCRNKDGWNRYKKEQSKPVPMEIFDYKVHGKNPIV